MANSTVSIYIDDTAVRVMVTRGKRIVKLAELALESGLGSIDTAEKEAELAGKIHQLLKFNKIGERKIILGLSGLRCLTRPIVLPELPKAMLGEAVLREAKRMLPMPLEQLYVSWKVVSVSHGKTNVFLVALPRQVADMLIRIITKAGCKPYLMDIKPLALARLSKEATAIIIDVQHKEFDIVMMVNGIPQPIRTVAFPQDALPLQDKFNIVKEDLKRTFDFLKSKVEENQIKPDTTILVSGELVDHPELYEPLAKELGLKVALLTSPLKYLKYLEPKQYMVNAGLALKELVKDAGPLLPNFNTLPEPYQPHHISMNRLMAVPAGLAAVGIIVLLTMTIQNAAAGIEQSRAQLESTKNLINVKVEQKKAFMDKVAALEQQVSGAEAEYGLYTNALKMLSVTGNNMNNDLTASVDNVNSNLKLLSLNLNASQITMSGSADSEEDVFKYVRDLTGTGRFKEITIASISLDGTTGGVTYSLSCSLEVDRK